jgi:hypothetical protein
VGTEVSARREADEGERAEHETATQPGDCCNEHDRDRYPVGRVQPHTGRVEAGLDWVARGGVVQLVRTPACHAGGRGFESRRSRTNFLQIGNLAAPEAARPTTGGRSRRSRVRFPSLRRRTPCKGQASRWPSKAAPSALLESRLLGVKLFSAMRIDVRAGAVIAGFRVDSLLGEGAMGAVYLAEEATSGRRVALKLLAPELAGDERFRRRFLRETEIARGLDHPNIVPTLFAGEEDGRSTSRCLTSRLLGRRNIRL